jgi:hypothetical protein
MPTGTYAEQRRKQAARPASSVAQIRARAITRLLEIAENGSERPEACVAACRVFLDLTPEREPSATMNALPSDELQRRAAAAIAMAFREIEPFEPAEADPPSLPAPPSEPPHKSAEAEVVSSMDRRPPAVTSLRPAPDAIEWFPKRSFDTRGRFRVTGAPP